MKVWYTDISDRDFHGGADMVLTLSAAAAVIGSEAIVRRRVNAAPAETWPKAVSGGVELRRAHNYGLVGSRFEEKPKLVYTYQALANLAAVSGAVLVNTTLAGSALTRLGMGLLTGGALANLIERLQRGCVTDYLHGVDQKMDLLNRRIWNLADMAIFNGAVLAAIGLVL